ncbi:conserved hypothetical protein [Candidatus Terasakiella magnetica]|nr:conserved hypothetical protein [Candidatus Terasakiella magnetica]
MSGTLGLTNRILRVIIGLVLIGLASVYVIGPWGWVGMLPIVTAAVGWCPLTSLFAMRHGTL